MSIVFRYDGALLPYQSVRLTGSGPGGVAGLPAAAWYGEAIFAGVTIDDPTGILNFNGLHTFTVEESACSKPRMFTGWITSRNVSRGPYRNGAGRVWDCTIIDQNWIFSLQAFRSTADSVRPAETDVARVQSAITSSAMANTPIHNNGRFSTAGPLSLSAANFVAEFPIDMIGSSASQTGKNFYAYWDDSARQISLHYDLVGTGPAATISFSNVLSDVNHTTVFEPFIDASWTSDPADLDTGVLLMTAAGNVYGTNSTVIASLSPSEFSPVQFMRDIVIRSDRISKAATRDAFLQKYLTIHSTEKQTLEFDVRLPAAKVNLANAGDVVNVRFSHLPNYTTSTPVSIIRRQVVPAPDLDDYYDVHFECTSSAAAKGPGGGGGGNLPPGDCTPDLAQSVNKADVAVLDPPVLAQAPTVGNFLVVWAVFFGVPGDEMNPTGFTGLGSGWYDDPSGTKNIRCRMFYRQVQSGDTATIAVTKTGSPAHVYMSVAEIAGVSAFEILDVYLEGISQSGDPIVIAAGPVSTTTFVGQPVFALGAVAPSLNVNDAWFPHDEFHATEISSSGRGGVFAGGTAPKSWFGYKAGPSAVAGAVELFTIIDSPASGICRGHVGLLAVFTADPCSAGVPPVTGQPVTDPPATAPGGGDPTGTTDNGFASNSLFVFVDGIYQPVQEIDPFTGEYQLYFDPRPSEVVIKKYQAG